MKCIEAINYKKTAKSKSVNQLLADYNRFLGAHELSLKHQIEGDELVALHLCNAITEELSSRKIRFKPKHARNVTIPFTNKLARQDNE